MNDMSSFWPLHHPPPWTRMTAGKGPLPEGVPMSRIWEMSVMEYGMSLMLLSAEHKWLRDNKRDIIMKFDDSNMFFILYFIYAPF